MGQTEHKYYVVGGFLKSTETGVPMSLPQPGLRGRNLPIISPTWEETFLNPLSQLGFVQSFSLPVPPNDPDGRHCTQTRANLTLTAAQTLGGTRQAEKVSSSSSGPICTLG